MKINENIVPEVVTILNKEPVKIKMSSVYGLFGDIYKKQTSLNYAKTAISNDK